MTGGGQCCCALVRLELQCMPCVAGMHHHCLDLRKDHR